MNSQFSIAAHWPGQFDEAGLQQWAESLRSQLGSSSVDLGLVFLSPRFFPHAQQVLEIIRVHARVPLLAGCSSQGLIAGGEELEDDPGIALALYSMPEARLQAVHFTQTQVEEASEAGFWRRQSGIEPDQINAWLVFVNPFDIDSEVWLRTWNEDYAPRPVLGGLASGDFTEQRAQVYLNGEVYENGGVAIAVGGAVTLASVISQGCTPIGETWTLTRVEQNIIHEIGNRPAYEVLAETFNQLSPAEQKVARGNLFIGLVVNEYLEDFHRGDFLIRNLLGADPQSGSIAVGAFPRPGQTVQFQRRSAAAAMEDLTELLERAGKKLGGKTVYGGCLCSCNGRGRNLFGRPNYDAGTVQTQLGPIGVAGFFCNGEIGPIGDRNFLHGYTASLALFVEN